MNYVIDFPITRQYFPKKFFKGFLFSPILSTVFYYLLTQNDIPQAMELDDSDVFTMSKTGILALEMNRLDIATISFQKVIYFVSSSHFSITHYNQIILFVVFSQKQ